MHRDEWDDEASKVDIFNHICKWLLNECKFNYLYIQLSIQMQLSVISYCRDTATGYDTDTNYYFT